MNIDVGNVKGFEDYLPQDAIKREKIREVAKKHFKLYGFMPVESPSIEYDELLKPSILPSEQEEDISLERFRVEDRTRRLLSLRGDFSVQLAKLIKKDPQIKLPLRTYQIDNAFRDIPLRSARTRQFNLIEANIVGDATQEAEAELLLVVSEILKELGIDFEINISNKKLIESLIDSVQIDNKRQVLRELDKINKIGEDLVKMNLKKYADSNQIITLFKMLEKSIEFFNQNAFEGASEVNSLLKMCNKNNVSVRFNPFIIKSLSNYSGNMFEILVDKNSIAGGGRTESLGRFVSRAIPSVGISFSLEAIADLCKNQMNNLDPEVHPKILVISIEKDSDSKKLIKVLRENGISCLMTSDKPGSSLEYAGYYRIPYVIFLGREEVEKQKFKLRIMKNAEEKQLTEKQIISFFNKQKNQKKDVEEKEIKENETKE